MVYWFVASQALVNGHRRNRSHNIQLTRQTSLHSCHVTALTLLLCKVEIISTQTVQHTETIHTLFIKSSNADNIFRILTLGFTQAPIQ